MSAFRILTAVDMRQSLIIAATNSKEKSAQIVDKWLAPGGYHWATLKATSRRKGGPHHTKTIKKIDLNEELASVFYSFIMKRWDIVFNKKLPDLRKPYTNTAVQAFEIFAETLRESVTAVSSELSDSLSRVLAPLANRLTQLRRAIKARFDELKSGLKEIHRLVKKQVYIEMAAVYTRVAAESGKLQIN